MRYRNAAEILPANLLKEIQKHVEGGMLYIPEKGKKAWGLESGARNYYADRNKEMKEKYAAGNTFEELAEQYGLAYSTIKKIIYCS